MNATRILSGIALLLGWCAAGPVTGQVLLSDPFTGTSATAYRSGGSAGFTAPSLDAPGQGYLRLTNADYSQVGFVVARNAFASGQGFNISFDFFNYGNVGSSSPGDGFSVFLVDGSIDADAFTPGAYGGALGYSQHADPNDNPTDGASGGYVGIGFDEFGFYASSQGHSDGLGQDTFPNRVSVRGPGMGQDGYNLLQASDPLTLPLHTATTRAQPGSADYRHATILIVPTNGGYQLTVRVQNSSQVTTVLRSVVLPAPPATLRLGFAASTGAATDVHELRNLVVVVPASAVDDDATTGPGEPVNVAILNNDSAPGTSFDPATIDLDPSTVAIDQTLTTSDGTFTVGSDGTLTFTPAAGGSNLAQISYVVSTLPVYDADGNVLTPSTTTNLGLVSIHISAPLAVSLTSFTAVPNRNGEVELRWTTASEINSHYFEVQRSLDGTAFQALGRRMAHGASQTTIAYSFMDAQPLATTAYYRLRQVDLDNTAAYSGIVAVAAGGMPASASLWPTPVTNDKVAHLSLGEQAGSGEAIHLRIWGATSAKLVDERLLPASTELAWSVAAYPAGVYLVEAVGASRQWHFRLLVP